MKRLTVKSNLRRERMPEWLLFILDVTLDGLGKAAPLDDTYEELEYIQWAVRSDLELLKVKTISRPIWSPLRAKRFFSSSGADGYLSRSISNK